MTKLFGREPLLREVRNLLDEEGAVCLVGPPGVGKSALARALEIPIWVDLEGVSQGHELIARIARVLECPVESRQAVEYALSSTPAVVLDAVGDLDDELHALLEQATRTQWVLTSRRRPDLEPSVVEVGPLPTEPAIALLKASVRSTRVREQLDPSGLEALVRAVDGLPLALELAAAQLRLFSPEDLASRPFLEGAGAQVLTDAIANLMDQVSPQALELLGRASVLPGTFDAATLATTTPDPIELPLLELLDHALIQPDGASPPQFRLLRPIRSVVRRRSGDTLHHETLGNLAAHWLPLAEHTVQTGGPTAALERMAPVLDALTHAQDPNTALRAALALGTRDRRMGGLQAVLERAKRLPDGGDPDLRVRWACMRADAHRRFSDPAISIGILKDVEPLLTEVTQPAWDNVYALCSWLQGDLERALPMATSAAERGADPALWHWVGAMRLDTGDMAGAISALRTAIQAADPLMRGGSLGLLASALHEVGSYEECHAVLDAIDIAESPRLEAQVWEVRGFLHADAGAHDAAQQAFQRASDLSMTYGERDAASMRWLMVQLLEFSQGRIPTTLLTPSPFGRTVPMIEGCIRGWRAVVHAALGHPDAALAIGPSAVAVVCQGSPHNASDLAGALATAVAPFDRDAAASLLASVPPSDCTRRAQAMLAGEQVGEPRAVYDWILAGLVGLQRSGVQIARDGTAFVTDTGERVDIARRKVLQRVLGALAQAEGPLGVGGICSAAWPGERLVGSSGTRRVHVAISTLRSLGLRSVLRTIEATETTWVLDATIVDEC